MCIVLPHGVLFRGGSEKQIRTNLIELNNIETIIGLPANIFYGTGIPTIIMVLKKHRISNDVLFIDASKEFYKDGNKNKLGGQNIKKITDVVLTRKDVAYFSKLVSKEEIISNDYNLNIPRYISSTKEELPYDINAIMLGDIPNYEIDDFSEYWDAFPTLKDELFKKINEHKSKIITNSLKSSIGNNNDVKEFIASYNQRFLGLDNELFNMFMDKDSINIYQLKNDVANLLFSKCDNLKLIDKYDVYKAFDDIWSQISVDLELIKAHDGISICREIEDIEVYDKKTKTTISKGQQGKILPFDLIKNELYKSEYISLNNKVNQLETLNSQYNAVLDELDADVKSDILKDESDNEVDNKKLKAKYRDITRNSSIKNLQTESMDEDDSDSKIKELYSLSVSISDLSKEIKNINKTLDEKVIDDIGKLSDEIIYKLLRKKWVLPIINGIHNLTSELINAFISRLNNLLKKYSNPLKDIDADISNAENNLVNMLSDLTGSKSDMEGLEELAKLLRGEKNE